MNQRPRLRAGLFALALAGCPAPTAPTPPIAPTPGPGPDPTWTGGGEPGAVEPGPGGEPVGGAPSEPPASTMATALLAEHNAVRARHCAPPLTWSPKLAAVAQAWAEHLRDHGCGFDHSRSSYGENLAGGTAGTLDAAAIVGMWAEEESAYDFAHGGFSMDTGHFTQVVWRATRQVGCGMATCNGMDTWVCNYDPPGNMEGDYADNVAPPRC